MAATNVKARCARIHLQRDKPDEPAHHRAQPVERDVSRRVAMAQASHRRLAEKRDHNAADRNLRAHIAEDGHPPSRRCRNRHAPPPLDLPDFVLLNKIGQIDEAGEDRHRERTAGQDYIRHPHRASKLCGSCTSCDEDESSTNLWSDGGRQRVESSGKVKPRGRRLWAAKNPADIAGIDRHLQQC